MLNFFAQMVISCFVLQSKIGYVPYISTNFICRFCLQDHSFCVYFLNALNQTNFQCLLYRRIERQKSKSIQQTSCGEQSAPLKTNQPHKARNIKGKLARFCQSHYKDFRLFVLKIRFASFLGLLHEYYLQKTSRYL